MFATVSVSLAGRLHETSGCLYPEVLGKVHTAAWYTYINLYKRLQFHTVRRCQWFFWCFWDMLMHFHNKWRQGTGDVKGVQSFHVTAAAGCFRMEPRFSRSGLIVAWGAPCIQSCTFRSPTLLMQVIKCFNIESCERGTMTDMPLSEDSFCRLNLDFQDILSS